MIKLPKKRYEIIYADPPWSYSNVIRNRNKDYSAASDHYPTMKTADICALPIQGITAENCILFMWTTGPQMGDAIRVGNAWGFEYATVAFVWEKNRRVCGYYTMSRYEYVLAFRHGTIPKPRGDRNVDQKVKTNASRHSEKPAEIRRRIERMFPEQSKIELFARPSLIHDMSDWDVWGNEVHTI